MKSQKPKNLKKLRRYTDLSEAIYILSKNKLSLHKPSLWDDKNDSFFIKQYKSKCKFKSVLVLCFSGAKETYHHWKIYASGPAGICIEFKFDSLCDDIDKYKNKAGVLIKKKVTYMRIDKQEESLPIKDKKDLPFTKRKAFKDEKEYRIIYASKENKPHLDIDLSPTTISRIILSPWLPKSRVENMKENLKDIGRHFKLEIKRSSLLNNEQWKKIAVDTT